MRTPRSKILFMMVAVAVGVLSFAAVASAAGTFVDDDGNIHEGAIEAIAAGGITLGCNPPSNDLYCPASSVTRGQMAAFLVRARELPPSSTDHFVDDDGSIFENDINSLADAGITLGCNPPANDEYCPSPSVTRQQMAAFLVRAFDLVDDGSSDWFNDDDGSIFEDDINKLAQAGITLGCNPPANTNFCPTDPVRRDQMASFLTRALSLTPLPPPPEQPSLWITDDVTEMVYNVSLDGDVLSEFPVPGTRSADSSIAIDPVDRTLWGANDGSSARLVNYDRSGNVIGEEILASEFGGLGTEGLDVTVSANNRTLWVVADGGTTTPPGYEPTVYNVSRSGDLISSFPTTTYDAAATSPQAIAYDPFTSSLWITDNDSDKVYNISLQGALLSSFAVNSSVFEQVAGDGGITNVQGAGVESAEVIWITARDTGRVYRLKKTGTEVISSFLMSDVDPAAEDPTGVAFDRPPG